MALGIRGPGLGAITVGLLLVFSNRLGALSDDKEAKAR